MKKRLRLIAAAIMGLGLGAATFTYIRAVNSDNLQDQDIQNSKIQNSKKYIRNLKLYGGEMAVMEDEICRWFDGLWQGTSLAYTIACITILTSCGFLLTAHHLSSTSRPDSRGKDDR